MKKTDPEKNGIDAIVVIGASAGGLQAFKDFLGAVEKNSSLAYVLLQHLDPSHKSVLPELLQDSAVIPVLEIAEGMLLERDKVFVLPSNAVPTLSDGVFHLEDKDAQGGSTQLLDDFFHNAAQEYGNRLVGVLLSGTGDDGIKGLREIKQRQGVTFAQDLDSAKWPGMPEHAIEQGVIDFVLPPAQIAKKIHELNFTKNPDIEHSDKESGSHDEMLREILQILHQQEDMDFSNYKKNTILRRVNRRVLLNEKNSLSEYLKYFKDNKNEVEHLFNDLLIPVTEFFRNEATFDFLKKEIFPKLLAGKGNDDAVRIWVAGCSTGQEAYSIAICLMEYLNEVGDDNPYGEIYTTLEGRIKIFATDLSQQAIARARKGIYKKTELKGVGDAYLNAYFDQDNRGYKVKKSLRKMCVFAEHDFLNDFPFGSMNMVSCRNVLIYMDAALQQKALTNFHYALKEKGILLLGNSETVSSVPELFNNIEKGHKIYRRGEGGHKTFSPLSKAKTVNKTFRSQNTDNEKSSPDSRTHAENLLLKKYVPVAIVLDQSLDLINVYGKTGRYLEHTSGDVSNNILKLAKGSLGFEIRRLIKGYNPEKDEKSVKRDVKLETGGKEYRVHISVSLLTEMRAPHYLVVFQDEEVKKSVPAIKKEDEKDQRIASLEKEIEDLRDEILNKLEEHQVAEEKLHSANEELMSGTEELQTLNEELETSKEELQSTVEEITVVNQELNTLNSLLNQEKKFSEGIVRTIRDPLLVLNKNFEVIMANRSFYNHFKVSKVDTVGVSIYELGNGQWEIPKLHTLLESILPSKESFTDYEVSHEFESIGKRSLLLNGQVLKDENKEKESIFLAFEDITAKKEARSKLKESIYTHHEFIRSSPWPIAILKGKDYIIEIVNDSMLKALRRTRNIMGQPYVEAMPELANQGFINILDQVYNSGVAHEDFQVPAHLINDNGEEELDYFDYIYQPQRNLEGDIIGVAIIATVVTEQVFLNEKLKKSEKQFRQLANNLPELIISYDIKQESYYYNKSFLDFTGLSKDELNKKQWHSVVHPDDYNRMVKDYGENIEGAKDFEMELRIRDHQGNYLWCLNRNHCITSSQGKAIRWVSTNTVIQRLKDEEKRKEDFLKLVSHELKTPVTSIKGYVQMLLSMISKDTGKPINELPIESSLIRVENQITRLTHLISEMLDLSRMEESKLELKLEDFDLCKLVEATIQDVQHSSGMIDIQVSYSNECNIKADKDRIGQVLINFITNAIKYSPDDKDISVKVYNDEPGFVSVSVKDAGIGINDDDLPRIFDRFYRVSGKNEGTYSGFGIGLYLAKEIIDRHNGKIKVESVPGQGSTFTFSLPQEK